MPPRIKASLEIFNDDIWHGLWSIVPDSPAADVADTLAAIKAATVDEPVRLKAHALETIEMGLSLAELGRRVLGLGPGQVLGCSEQDDQSVVQEGDVSSGDKRGQLANRAEAEDLVIRVGTGQISNWLPS